MAYDTPDSTSAFSSAALPRKYSSGQSSDGLVMLTWTIRWTPACLGRLKQDQRVPHGVGVLEQPVVEPHPVRVVEDRNAAELLRQSIRLVEVKRKRLDAVAEGVLSGE